MMLQGPLSHPTTHTMEEEQKDGEEQGTGVHPSAVPWLVGQTAEGACVSPGGRGERMSMGGSLLCIDVG
jgi:small neutral amino acid transporter SnatA (MarC family)